MNARSCFLFIGFIAIVILISCGSWLFAGRWLVREDIPPHADAMVLLMGSFPERVLQAADLYHQGVSGQLIIVYEGMGSYKILEGRGAKIIRTTEQARDAAVALGIRDSCITMPPGDARSTLDEALAVRDYLTGRPSLDTLILVSSPTHIRRAYMIFKKVFNNSDLKIYIGTSPGEYSSFNRDRWWREKEDIQQVLSEWVKIASFVLFEKRKID